MKRAPDNRGVALAVAITVCLMICLLAAVVLNITFRRFNLSFFQQSRAIALYASEAGILYVDTRIKLDTTFRNAVLARSRSTTPPSWYIISSMTTDEARAAEHIAKAESVDEENLNALEMGGSIKKKEVTLRVREDPNNPGRYETRVRASYGTGI